MRHSAKGEGETVRGSEREQECERERETETNAQLPNEFISFEYICIHREGRYSVSLTLLLPDFCHQVLETYTYSSVHA